MDHMGYVRRIYLSETLRWKYSLGTRKYKRKEDMRVVLKEIRVRRNGIVSCG
jgi:hypothetical protein